MGNGVTRRQRVRIEGVIRQSEGEVSATRRRPWCTKRENGRKFLLRREEGVKDFRDTTRTDVEDGTKEGFGGGGTSIRLTKKNN